MGGGGNSLLIHFLYVGLRKILAVPNNGGGAAPPPQMLSACDVQCTYLVNVLGLLKIKFYSELFLKYLF